MKLFTSKEMDKLNRKYIKKVERASKLDDEEVAHLSLDYELCELLKELGFKKIAKIFDDTLKWYA